MTEQLERKADVTRLQIVLAASHEFARKSYSRVSLDDILAQAEVTKGAMYFHFRSKHELALAIIELKNLVARGAMNDILSRKLSALETIVDVSCLVATRDIGDDVMRAGLNLLESIGRSNGVQAAVLQEWIQAFTAILQRAIDEGDVLTERDPEEVSRLLASMYLGLRQTSDLDDPERFLADLEKNWKLLLPGFANPDRIGYFNQFIRRRTALAAQNVKPLRRHDL